MSEQAYAFPAIVGVLEANPVPDLIGRRPRKVAYPDEGAYVRGLCREAGIPQRAGGYTSDDILDAYARLREQGRV